MDMKKLVIVFGFFFASLGLAESIKGNALLLAMLMDPGVMHVTVVLPAGCSLTNSFSGGRLTYVLTDSKGNSDSMSMDVEHDYFEVVRDEVKHTMNIEAGKPYTFNMHGTMESFSRLTVSSVQLGSVGCR
jgi:hypothetical protein